MRIRFLTSTPLNVARGSGTFTALETLIGALRARGGVEVEIVPPRVHLPVFTAERYLYNRGLRRMDRSGVDFTVGVDLDGYTIAGTTGPPHIASIKGVIADEALWETGITRRLLEVQAGWERRHIERAALVIAPSRYSAARIRELYGFERPVVVAPEPVALEQWKGLLERNRAAPDSRYFTVLSVCRFYRRKRVDVLIRAAALLRKQLPELRVRLVGAGPEDARLRSLAWNEGVTDRVEFLGAVGQEELARELNGCDVFCLPTVQESFGMVFLEAMAARKPIVAARAGAVPEVAPQAFFADPDDAQSLAQKLTILASDPIQRTRSGEEGWRRVEQFDAPRVAERFLEAIAGAGR